jgi:REP element-mobilizing transposase RayT
MRKFDFVNGEFYHIFNRGVDKRRIFQDEIDFKNFLECLHLFNDALFVRPTRLSRKVMNLSMSERYDHEREHFVDIYAYSLIPNHFHLLFRQLRTDGISRLMHKLEKTISNTFNRRNGRTGTLFEGNFKAVHVTNESHLIYLPTYIHLNVLDVGGFSWRDGIVENWEEAVGFMERYPWSSHGAYMGQKQYLPIVREEIVQSLYTDIDDYLSHIKGWSQRSLGDHLSKIS